MVKNKKNAKYKGFSQDFINQIENLKLIADFAFLNVCAWIHKDFIQSFSSLEPILYFNHADSSLIKVGKSDVKSDISYDLSERLKDILKNPQSRNDVVGEFIKFSIMVPAMIKLYEAFNDGAERYKIVEKESWFIFLRNLRNAAAHGIDMIWGEINDFCSGEVFYIRKLDGKKIVLSKNLEGQGFDLEHIGGIATLIDLLAYARDFARQKAKNHLKPLTHNRHPWTQSGRGSCELEL